MRGVEIVALDVETGQRQTMARRFLRVLVRRGHFAHALTQRDRSRAAIQRGAQALQRAIRRAILDEQLGIKQGRLDFANRFFVIVAHQDRIRGISPTVREGSCPHAKGLQILSQGFCAVLPPDLRRLHRFRRP